MSFTTLDRLLTKLINLFALHFQLLNQLADLALFGQTLAVLHVIHIYIQTAWKQTAHAEE